MQSLGDTLLALATAFAKIPVNPAKALCLIYLGTALLIAFAVLWRRARAEGGASLRSVLSALFPRKVWLHRSARVDYRYFFVNGALMALLVAPVVLSAPLVAYGAATVLEALFGAQGPAWPPSLAAGALLAVAVLAASDFGFYCAHAAMHRIGWLWEFHKVHHSAEVLTPVTNHRTHPVQTVLFALLTAGFSGIVLGTFDYLFDYDLTPLQIIGVNVATFVYASVSLNLQHSHVWISYGALDRLFVSPAMHQVHHSDDPRHAGRNLGAVFSIWDGIFGTRYLPRGIEDLTFGLGEGEEAEFQGVLRLYAIPFRNVGRRVRAKLGRRASPVAARG